METPPVSAIDQTNTQDEIEQISAREDDVTPQNVDYSIFWRGRIPYSEDPSQI